MIIVWPKYKSSSIQWRGVIHSYLTNHVHSDVSRLCIEYLLPPPGRSCSDTCMTIDFPLGHISRNDYHLNTCPIAPGLCFICSKHIDAPNDKCKKSWVHWLYTFTPSTKIE